MPHLVAIDARDAYAQPLRGWGRYALELIRHLPPELDVREYREGGPGPEIVFEQLVLPLRLRRDRVALVHSPNCFLPLMRPCPGVVTIHDLAFERYPEDFSPRTGAKYRHFTRRAARSAERVICDARFTADDLATRYGVDESRIRVIPLAPSLPTGDEEPPPGPYVLAVGDLRAKKNLGRLIEAWQRADLPHRLVLAGLGEMKEVPAGVELTGYVSDGRLDALMRGADLVVHPSLYEGFGLVVLEAMVRGTPVAAARATALPETGGDAAVWFDPLDVDDMARAIVEALGDRDEFSARGRDHAARFSWDATAAATTEVYRELLG